MLGLPAVADDLTGRFDLLTGNSKTPHQPSATADGFDLKKYGTTIRKFPAQFFERQNLAGDQRVGFFYLHFRVDFLSDCIVFDKRYFLRGFYSVFVPRFCGDGFWLVAVKRSCQPD